MKRLFTLDHDPNMFFFKLIWIINNFNIRFPIYDMNQEPILFGLDRDHFSPGSTSSGVKIVNGLKIRPFCKNSAPDAGRKF